MTTGCWESEAESCQALDEVLSRIGLWRVYEEVPGALLQPRPAQSDAKVRIDRVLVPTSRLIQQGWQHGVVGIEVKRSGIKIGPPIAQAMDYLRAAWQLPGNDIRVLLDWVFIWPMARQMGTVASILSQQRIGSACSDKWTLLHLKSGEQNVIKVEHDGTVDIGTGANGRRVGSR